MTSPLKFFAKKYHLDLDQKPPIKITGLNRTTMTKHLHQLGYKTGAEIGVAQGWHAELLCRHNPNLKLYAVDIWQSYPGYNEYRNRIVEYHQQAKQRLAPYNAVLIQKYSMDAVGDFPDNSLDFVYIDSAHDFKNVAMDICEWAPKVRVGGMVFGHDYKRSFPPKNKHTVHVKDVVQAYMYAHGIKPWFELANDVPDPLWHHDSPGWMFIRQTTDRI